MRFLILLFLGGCDRDPALKFIQGKFQEKNTDSRQLYMHVTCATNTENVEVVFNAVRSECLKEMLNALNVI